MAINICSFGSVNMQIFENAPRREKYDGVKLDSQITM